MPALSEALGGARREAAGDVRASGRASRWRPRLVSVAVAVLGLAVTAGLTAASRINYQGVEQRLTRSQARLTVSALEVAPLDLERRLGPAATLAADGAGPAAFGRAMRPSLGKSGPFQTAALVRVTTAGPRVVATFGSAPSPGLGAGQERGPLERAAQAPGQLEVTRMVGRDGRQRFGYALGASQRAGTFVAYATQTLPRHATLPPGNPDANLRFAIYYGAVASPGALVETNANHLPVRGLAVSEAAPFGDQTLTLVVAARDSLAGELAADMPWLIAAVGLALTVIAAMAAERLVRRREGADRRAAGSEQRYRQQRAVAEALQRSLLPARLPEHPELEVAVRYLPGTDGIEVGGDWYDLVDVDDRSVVFTVGDVVGRGLDAATVMAALRHQIDAHAAAGAEPEQALARAGRLVDLGVDGRFATAVCGRLDLPSGLLRVANAGHPAPVHLSAGRCRLLPTVTGAPVGIGWDYTPVDVQLQPGDILLAYTDGLIERRGESIDRGLQRLCAAADTDLPLDQLLDHVLASLTPDGPPDDIALLGLRWMP